MPAEPSSGWGHAELIDWRLARVWARLAKLREAGVTPLMVAREFIRRRIAPLQCHSRPMWTFTGPKDPMRLQETSLPAMTLGAVLELLTSNPAPAELPAKAGLLLYHCSDTEDFVG